MAGHGIAATADPDLRQRDKKVRRGVENERSRHRAHPVQSRLALVRQHSALVRRDNGGSGSYQTI